jgi:hypothetical protein
MTLAQEQLVFVRECARVCGVASRKVHTTGDFKFHKSVGILLVCGSWFHGFELLLNISFNITAFIGDLCSFLIVIVILK